MDLIVRRLNLYAVLIKLLLVHVLGDSFCKLVHFIIIINTANLNFIF